MSKKEKAEISSREKKTKRLKTHHSRPNILSIIPVNVDCFRLEEVEPADNILDEVSQTSDKIREHMHAISIGKRGKENEAILYQHRDHVSMLMMHMKKLNRLDKHQWKKSRDAVNEQKQRVDAKHLLYQNLLYEATHLQKEVTKCMEFRSKDEEIELVSVEEFYRDAPEHISKPEITKFDQHELTLARLFWESEQRKEFAQKLKEAEIAMQEYIQIRKKMEENLSSVLPILKSIIDAAEPMQTKMGMPFKVKPLKHKIAKYLPKSLYVLYVQISAYCEHKGGKRIQISVEGNVSDAKALQTKPDDLSEDSGESDREESSEMNTHKRAATQKKTESSRDILLKHPMTVHLTIDKESKLTLEFCYLVYLNIVTVRVLALSPEPMSTDSIGDLLQLDSFLNCLFPGDQGKNSPNLACIHQLKTKYGYDDPPFKNETTGWPYNWAQKLAGLQFMHPLSEKDWLLKFSYTDIPASVDMAIHAMCSRLVSRHQLYQQISSIDQRINVPPTFSSLYPLNISSQLKKWSPVSWRKALSNPNIQELQDLNILNEDMLLYKAEIQRGSALLTTLIAIPPNYPEKTPIFLLQLSWKGSHTTVSSFALKELEEEVNVHFVESLPHEFKSNLLVCQIYHLVVCFDVFLETESSGDSFEGPSEFMREKVVVRYSRGCGRSRPYKCVSSQGIFTYR